MLKYLLITNNVDIARVAFTAGVNRIFIDLESIGKQERQGGLDTHISDHCYDDVDIMRSALRNAELLVRINPIHAGTQDEINEVIARGADFIMLPMFSSANELRQVIHMIARRAQFIPLIETVSAMQDIKAITETDGIDEIYIGLNDLHLALKMPFMFEPLANGMLEKMVKQIQTKSIPFGFGGIARVGEGLLPAEDVLTEHCRLGSSRVILSRTFHRNAKTVDELDTIIDFAAEVNKLRKTEQLLQQRKPSEVANDYKKLKDRIMSISKKLQRSEYAE